MTRWRPGPKDGMRKRDGTEATVTRTRPSQASHRDTARKVRLGVQGPKLTIRDLPPCSVCVCGHDDFSKALGFLIPKEVRPAQETSGMFSRHIAS